MPLAHSISKLDLKSISEPESAIICKLYYVHSITFSVFIFKDNDDDDFNHNNDNDYDNIDNNEEGNDENDTDDI